MITKALISDLEDKAFREAFLASHARQTIILQLADLLAQEQIKQPELERRSGVAQSTISRTLDPEFGGGASVNTLVRLANGLDVAFVPHFVPWTDLLDWIDARSDNLRIP